MVTLPRTHPELHLPLPNHPKDSQESLSPPRPPRTPFVRDRHLIVLSPVPPLPSATTVPYFVLPFGSDPEGVDFDYGEGHREDSLWEKISPGI